MRWVWCAGLIAVSGWVAGCQQMRAYSDLREGSYVDMSAVQRANSGSRSWIPEWIPGTAVNIREKHNLDTNEQILRFGLGGVGLPSAACLPAALPAPPKLAAEWWPDPLPEGREYECGTDTGRQSVVVVDDDVYVWHNANR
ncbi:hypothetical protein [Nocardia sp. NPDC052566]|uniref:hypothetical protein n=1 Tax=Nocardia sp. NPDC052566 TaxID=3364330 RepID=UPI0037CBC435